MAGKVKKQETEIGEAPPMPQNATGGVGFNKFNGATFDGPAVFVSMNTAFDRALQSFPDELEQSHFEFGGQHVSMRIVGRELAKHIVQAFAHLKLEKELTRSPALTIDLWDENVTSIRCYTGSKTISEGWTDVTSISPDGRYIGQLQPSTLSCFDRQGGRILASVVWSDRIFIYERAKPLSRLLLEWHNDLGIQIIHAALVSRNDNGILFVAGSGSGKSTASLACLAAGFDYVGEDFIGLQRTEAGTFIGHSLYNSVFLETGHLTRFPELERFIIRGQAHEQKAAILLAHAYPERLQKASSVRAVVIPCLAKQSGSVYRPLARSKALLALGTSSLIEIPSRGMEGFSRLAQLVEQVPTYSFELGRDLQGISPQVDKLIAEVTRS